jgi:tetratricopeptide (TPR) repeat protein
VRCLDTTSILAFLDGLAGSEEAAAHAYECDRCNRLVRLALLGAKFSESEQDAVLAEILDRESDAAAAVSDLRHEPWSRWRSAAHTDPRLHHPASVRALLARCDLEYRVAPHQALELALIAADVAVALSAKHAIAPSLLSAAWRECAALYAACGLPDDALRSLEKAEEAFGETAPSDHERAILDHTRAWLYSKPDVHRLDDALSLLDQCLPVFRRYASAGRVRSVEQNRAVVLMRLGRDADALPILEELLAAKGDMPSTDRGELSRLAAECYRRLGFLTEASRSILAALDEDSKGANLRYQLALDRWILGKVRAAEGDFEAALDLVRTAAESVEEVGLDDTAMRIWLDYIEIQKERDPATDVSPCLEHIIQKSLMLDREQRSRLPAGGSAVSALTAEALHYLRREAESNTLTARMIRHVSGYLARLDDGDIRPFAEPPN